MPLLKTEINPYSRSDLGGMNLYKVIPPKNKTPFSSCFQSELELTQYLVLRGLEKSCADGVINCNGKNYYLDDKYISSMMKVSDFINSSESITGMSGSTWQITKEKYLTRLFDGTTQEQNDVLSYIDRHKTGVSLRGALTFMAAMMMPMEPEAVLGQRVLSYLGKVIPSGTVKVGARIPKFFVGGNKVGKAWDEWLKTLKTKINPRKDLSDGKFEKFVTGDDIQYEVIGNGEKIWADGIKIEANAIVDAKQNVGNFYTLDSYSKKSFMYGDLEDEFRRYSKVISDENNPAKELVIYISNKNDDSVKLFEYLGKKYNVKTKVELIPWIE